MHVLQAGMAALAAYRQFIVVQFVPSLTEPGKSDKHPINPFTGVRHDAHDPAIWLWHHEAADYARRFGSGFGVGFVLTANDPFACLDFDKCLNSDGWAGYALAILAEFPGSAVEVSNSGQGFHAWATYQGVAPAHAKKSKAGQDRKWLELYTELRFIALGGDCTGVMGDITQVLPGFIDKYFPRKNLIGEDEPQWTVTHSPDHSPLDDAEVMRRAMTSKGFTAKMDAGRTFGENIPTFEARATFAQMYNCDVAALTLAYPAVSPDSKTPYDASEVDFWCARELAYWTGKNCERVAALMDGSALKRAKWSPDNHRTYFQETVLRAVASCAAVYSARPVIPKPPDTFGVPIAETIIHNTFVSRDSLVALFGGCVYVQDQNSILLPSGDLIDQSRFNARFAGYSFGMDNANEAFAKSAWEGFLSNKVIRFPRVEGTVFRPDLPFQEVSEFAGRRWINVYRKPRVSRVEGDVSPFTDLLYKLLPRGDDAIILLSYIAACVQNPGVKFRWAPFVQGVQGNGKSTITECLIHALGQKYIFSVKPAHITIHFNAWLENNVLYVADDIYSSENRDDLMEVLKTLISDQRQGITYKGIDTIQKEICGNFIFNSNHKGAMRKQEDTRRIAVLYCNQQSKYDKRRDGLTKDYFNRLYRWLKDANGFSIVAEYLHTLQIDPRYDPAGECQEAPVTSVEAEAITDGRTGIEYEVAEAVELNEPGFCGDFISMHMLRKKFESNSKYSRSLAPLKIKEMLLRLGYEQHRHLPNGRTPDNVQPDGTRPVLFIKRESWLCDLADAGAIASIYSSAQQNAMTNLIRARFNQ